MTQKSPFKKVSQFLTMLKLSLEVALLPKNQHSKKKRSTHLAWPCGKSGGGSNLSCLEKKVRQRLGHTKNATKGLLKNKTGKL